MNKIIKGDQVIVITGKDKGKQGQVVRVLGDKVVVEGINVAIFNPETNKADRVGIKLVENEGKVKRVRVFKSNGAEIGA